MTTFTLSGLNSDFTTSGFQLNDIQSAAETIDFDFTVPVTMDKTHFNSVFYLSPEAPGLANLGNLANIDVFGNEEVLYLTKKDNFANAITGLTSAPATLVEESQGNTALTLNDSDQNIDETSIKVWSKNIFAGQQDLDDIWTTTSRDNVKSEMNTFMSKEDGLDDTSVVSLLKELKGKIEAADGLNNDNKTTANLTRQLVLQLHEQIYDSNLDADGDTNNYSPKAYRLTNAAGGIFRSGQEETISVGGADHVFYPFEFEAGDKMEFGLKFTHPASSYSSAAFEGAHSLPEIKLKVIVTMQ